MILLIDEEALAKLLKAGRIARDVRNYATQVVKPGMKVLELAEIIENRIRELGGEPAFPVNIGIDYVAAHYTPVLDSSAIPDNSVVKIDVGVHVDGYIADTAVTISFSPVYEGLVDAARKALEKAIEILKPGVKASEVGEVIERVIKSSGYKPVKNLSGHGISRFTIHSGITIPNYHDIFARHRLVEGVYAIEPFATNGTGLVRETELTTIYSLKHGVRNLPPTAKQFYNRVFECRRGLPFTLRWYARTENELRDLEKVVEALKRYKAIHEYPVLMERGRGLVAQFEHTVVVLKNEVIVTTE